MTTHSRQFSGTSQTDEFDDVVNHSDSDDHYDNGILYEFSVAPDAQFYNMDMGERGVTMLYEWHKQFSSYLSDISSYKMIVETAYPKYLRFTPGSKSRIHFHGTITFTDIVEFLTERAHHFSQICTFKISHYRADVWPQYIAKQRHLMEPKYGKLYMAEGSPLILNPRSASDAGVRDNERDPRGETKSRPPLQTPRRGALAEAPKSPSINFTKFIFSCISIYDKILWKILRI